MAPTLFLLCGLPCSGKTTLARRLERERHALRLTPDEWIAQLLSEDWDQAELERRENSQLPLDKKKEMSQYVIANAADADQVRGQVREVLSRILAKASAQSGRG